MSTLDALGDPVSPSGGEAPSHPELIARDPLKAPILPSSTLRDQTRGVKFMHGVKYIPIFCANCGKSGGYVPEPSKDFAFYLCDSPCGEMWSDVVGYACIPQEKFWEVARQEQLERYGREMTPTEFLVELDDPNSWIHKLIAEQDNIVKER